MKTILCSSRREEAHAEMFYAHPHPDPLPRGEGTAVGRFIFAKFFLAAGRARFAKRLETILPLPAGEGRGEGELSALN
jgi:hypothetical protein